MSIPSNRRPSAQQDDSAADELSYVIVDMEPPILGREDSTHGILLAIHRPSQEIPNHRAMRRMTFAQ